MAKEPESTVQDPQPTVVEQSVEAMRARVQELQPMYDEFVQAQHILSLIDSDGQPPAETPAPEPTPARSASSGGNGNGRRRGRRRSNTRGDQLLASIKEHPGETVTQHAERLGMASRKNYLYRIVSDLTKEGTIRKEGNALIAA